MRIFIDFSLSDQYLSGDSLFIKDLIAELARRNPMHSFVMPADQQRTAGTNLPPNITFYRINRFVLNWTPKRWWYKYFLPVMLKRLQADVFICIDNPDSPAASIPGCLFLTSLPQGFDLTNRSNRQMNQRLMNACLRSHAAVTFSGYDMQRMQQKYPAVSGKIMHLKLNTIRLIRPFTADEREAVKASYANGLEYFAFAGDLHENHLLTALLKAFSVFKKWQKSNMQLLITGSTTAWTDTWKQSLDAYKYRSDVRVFADSSKEISDAIIAGAYAFVYPARHDHLPVNILHAMQAGVPVITSFIPVIEEVAGQAVLYVPGNDEAGFAAAMQSVYKDEHMRDSLIGKGRKQLENSGNDIVDDCWNILQALSNLKS